MHIQRLRRNAASTQFFTVDPRIPKRARVRPGPKYYWFAAGKRDILLATPSARPQLTTAECDSPRLIIVNYSNYVITYDIRLLLGSFNTI